MACHLRRNAFESIKTRYVPNYIREQTPPTDVLKNLSGLSLCFLRIKYCLSVGAFFELLRANAVRPYRVLDKYFVISPLSLHTLVQDFCAYLLSSFSICFFAPSRVAAIKPNRAPSDGERPLGKLRMNSTIIISVPRDPINRKKP